MALSDRDLDAFVAAVVARLASGALGLARIWSGFAARLRKGLREEGDDFVRIIEAHGRATGQETGRILNASVGDSGSLGRAHVRKILEALVGRDPELPGFRPPDMGPYADEVARDVVARLKESFRTWKDQDHAEEQIVQLTGEHLDRLLTGNQTEGFKQYRGSLMAGYRAVPEVDRIVRRERLDSLTCAVCWALHGEILDKSEDLAVHPNCRGIPVPVLLGSDPRGVTGPEAFEDLSEAEQRIILGPRKFDLYRRGELRLPDLVHRGEHPEFGPFVREKTWKETQGAIAERQVLFMSQTGGGQGPIRQGLFY